MSRPRPNFGRGARAGGWFGGAVMKVDRVQGERDAAAGVAAAQAKAPIVRVAHPVLANPPSWCAFRVIRLVKVNGKLTVEDIGACASEREALAISTTELARAQVLDRNGKIVSDNWQRIEERA
jgi:hypothetical protein